MEEAVVVGELEKVKSKALYNVTKRIFDFSFSLICLVLLSPVFLIVAILIKLDSNGPIFYKSYRIGKNVSKFKFYKFRTMAINSDEIFANFTKEQKEEYNVSFKLDNDPRVTKIGRILRKTSLDELPQLINIINGSMSLIGPRPIIEREIERTGLENLKEMTSVRPGLSGWWACSGRSDTTWEEKTQLELYYVRNCSWKFDIKIFFKTIECVLKRDGAK